MALETARDLAEIKGTPLEGLPLLADLPSYRRAVADPALWLEYEPAAYRVRMVRLPEGTEIPNRLEWSVDTVKAGRIVLIGTAGEMWQVAPEKVMAKYRNLDGSPVTSEQLSGLAEGEPVCIETVQDGSAPHVWAFRTDVKDVGTILTDWGAVVPVNHPMVGHGDGDYVLVDSPDLIGVAGAARTVNGVVFSNTYAAVRR